MGNKKEVKKTEKGGRFLCALSLDSSANTRQMLYINTAGLGF